jgi:hypothetical protein
MVVFAFDLTGSRRRKDLVFRPFVGWSPVAREKAPEAGRKFVKHGIEKVTSIPIVSSV